MFGDAGQARTNAAMLQLMIATTSSRTCTKPTVVCCIVSETYNFNDSPTPLEYVSPF